MTLARPVSCTGICRTEPSLALMKPLLCAASSLEHPWAEGQLKLSPRPGGRGGWAGRQAVRTMQGWDSLPRGLPSCMAHGEAQNTPVSGDSLIRETRYGLWALSMFPGLAGMLCPMCLPHFCLRQHGRIQLLPGLGPSVLASWCPVCGELLGCLVCFFHC